MNDADDAGHIDYQEVHNQLVEQENDLTTQEHTLSIEKQLKALNLRNTVAKRSIEILEDNDFRRTQQKYRPIENLTPQNTEIVTENENHFREIYTNFINQLIFDDDDDDDETLEKIGNFINTLRRRFIRLRNYQIPIGGKKRISISRKSYRRHRSARSTKKRGTQRKQKRRRGSRRAH
jgi:hypothetical protein